MNPALLGMLGARLGLSAQELACLRTGDVAGVLQGRLGQDPAAAALLEALHAKPEEPEAPAQADVDAALRAGLEAAHDVVRFVAGTLGACTCFGQGPACPRCGGAGAPGWAPSSDARQLLVWALPALARLGLQVVRQPPPQGGHPKERS